MAKLSHTLNQRLHEELKESFETGQTKESSIVLKTLQEKVASCDEHINLL